MLPRIGKSWNFVLSAEFAALFQPVVEEAVVGYFDYIEDLIERKNAFDSKKNDDKNGKSAKNSVFLQPKS